MKISILAAAALLLAGTSMAQAAWDQNQTVLDLQAQGYTHIEITLGVTQAKVEASNGTIKVETVYDLVTGDVVKTETDAADPNESQTPRVEIKTTDEAAFVGGGDDDGEDDHKGGSSGPGSHDEADDNGSDDDAADDNSGHGGGDDSGDDNSGDDDSSDDDHGGDDHGGDDDGGDDHGGDDHSGHGGGDDD